MPVVSMELTSFSFKRDHDDWIGPIEVSFAKPDSCVALTGINAGGKSLALRALEKFTNLLADPSRPIKEEFEALARVAGIDEISATYSFGFPDIDDFYFVQIADGEKLLSASRAPSGGEVLEDEFFVTMKNSIETRFTKDGGFTRRFDLYLTAEFEYLDDHGEPDEWGLNEQMFLKWEKVFDDSTKLAKDRMFCYGPDGFENEILERTGVAVEPHGFEDHGFWDPEACYQFVAKEVIMLQVDEAYRVSPETIERLRPFNENANAKRKGKNWINKRLKTAFERCKKEFEEKWSDEYRRKSASIQRQKSKLSEDISKLSEDISKLTFPEIPELKKRLEEVEGREKALADSKEEHFDTYEHQEELASFLYPNRNGVRQWIDKKGEYRDDYFDWFRDDQKAPTVELRIPREEENTKTSNRDFTDDIEGICARLVNYCPHLLRKYDPNMLYWIIISNCIDFPDDPSPTYYSSGQRRMISMIEAIMKSEPGTVFLIDEPELSLHIDWQRRFIDQISLFSKRLVIATHSPDIIYNHTETVVEVPPSKEV